jgi:cullin 3
LITSFLTFLKYINDSPISLLDYMRKAEKRLAEEAHRVTLYLSPGTEPKLKHLSETELITLHARTLVEMDGSGSICLMRDDKIDDLKRMYTLFSRVPSTLDILRG